MNNPESQAAIAILRGNKTFSRDDVRIALIRAGVPLDDAEDKTNELMRFLAAGGYIKPRIFGNGWRLV